MFVLVERDTFRHVFRHGRTQLSGFPVDNQHAIQLRPAGTNNAQPRHRNRLNAGQRNVHRRWRNRQDALLGVIRCISLEQAGQVDLNLHDAFSQ